MRGLQAGMAPFFIMISGDTETVDGWEGSISQRYPSFWVVGCDEFDAIANAQRIIGIVPGDKVPHQSVLKSLRISACRADISEPTPVVAWDSKLGGYDVHAENHSSYWDGIILLSDGRFRGYLRHASGNRETESRAYGTRTEALAYVMRELDAMCPTLEAKKRSD